MRRSAIIGILAALVLVWLVAVAYLAMAGTAPAPTQTVPSKPARQPVDRGFVPLIPSDPARFSFTEVSELAALYPLEHLNGSVEKDFYYIAGKNVDPAGNAATWIYGMKNATEVFYLVYDVGGWQLVPAADTFPAPAIDTGALYNVSRIFAENGDLVASPSVTGREIEITANTTRILVREGAETKSYAFDSRTGALIPSHEE